MTSWSARQRSERILNTYKSCVFRAAEDGISVEEMAADLQAAASLAYGAIRFEEPALTVDDLHGISKDDPLMEASRAALWELSATPEVAAAVARLALYQRGDEKEEIN